MNIINKYKFILILLLITQSCFKTDTFTTPEITQTSRIDTLYLKDSFYINAFNSPIETQIIINDSIYNPEFNYKILNYFRNDTFIKADTTFPKLFIGQKVSDSTYVLSIFKDSVFVGYPIYSWIVDSVSQTKIKILGINQIDLLNSNLNLPQYFRLIDTARIFDVFSSIHRTSIFSKANYGKSVWTTVVLPNREYGLITALKSNFLGFGTYYRQAIYLAFAYRGLSYNEATQTIKSAEIFKVK